VDATATDSARVFDTEGLAAGGGNCGGNRAEVRQGGGHPR
jgi:hypothetical protein